MRFPHTNNTAAQNAPLEPISNLSGTVLLLTLIVASAANPANAQPAAPHNEVEVVQEQGPFEPASSTVVYERNFFERYNVTTALDMLRRVPGISDLLSEVLEPPSDDEEEARGFGSGGDQILINSKRIAGKANAISAALERIQAASVERIELIRGTTADVDVRSEGLIVNVVVAEEALKQGSGSWRLRGRIREDGVFRPGGFLSYNSTRGRLQYLVSVESEPDSDRRTLDEQFMTPQGDVFEQRNERQFFEDRPYKLTANLIYPFNNGDELRANGLVSYTDESQEIITDRFAVLNGMSGDFLETVIQREDEDAINWEVGLNFDKQIGSSGKWRSLFIYSFEKADIEENIRSVFMDEDTIQNAEQRETLDTEAILRSSYTWDLSKAHNLEIGAEGALNKLDTDLQIFEDVNGELVELDLFNPDSIVKEQRGEVFLTDRWTISNSLSAEIGVNGEFSRISQKGSEFERTRTFFFPKPRIDLRYDITATSQLRLKAERTVSQLEFADFVAKFDFEDFEVDFGNPDLKPEKAWEYEIRYEHRLPDDKGVIEVRGYFNDISDHIDKGLIDVDRDGVPDRTDSGLLKSAQANIGDALILGAETKASFRLGFVGLSDAIINARFLAQKTETTDPFTGEKRSIFRTSDFEWAIGYRHDVTKFDLAYGFDFERRIGERRTDDVRDTALFVPKRELSAFAEIKIFWDMTLRIDGEKLLNEKSRRSRLRFEDIVGGTLLREEFFRRESDRIFKITLRGQF